PAPKRNGRHAQSAVLLCAVQNPAYRPAGVIRGARRKAAGRPSNLRVDPEASARSGSAFRGKPDIEQTSPNNRVGHTRLKIAAAQLDPVSPFTNPCSNRFPP